MTDLAQALAVGRDNTRRFSVALIDLEKAYNNALAADVDVVSAMWMNLSMDCAKVSNDLIPRADADLAVALMVAQAATQADPWDGPVTKNKIVDAQAIAAQQIKARIRALAPADGLAAVDALRAEARENAMQALASMGQAQEAYEAQLEAEAELARVRARGERLVEALRFYADFHENPNDGPWGINSQDFGKEARAALTEGAAP